MSTPYNTDFKIVRLVAGNPKRGASRARFDLYFDQAVKTVGDFLARGGLRADLQWDIERGFIALD